MADANTIEQQRVMEDEVVKIINSWPFWAQATAYRVLYLRGIRIDNVDYIIRKEMKKD